jgi:predicted  nucleic acid-binding Zn-ribbon protein
MRLEKLQRLENKIKKVEDLQQLDKRAHSEIIDIKQKTAREKEKLKAEISKI